MVRAQRIILVILALVLGWPGRLASQQRMQATSPLQEEVRLGTIGINLPITVFDKEGRLVTDLTLENFQVREDGVPQQILAFSKENELPLSVGLLMDISNSVRPKLSFEQQATIAFLDAMIRPRKDRALFLTFSSTLELRQDFSDDLEDLKAAINSVRAGGATSLYDALYRVCEEKMTTAKGRKAIVVLSDGEDNASEHSLEEVIRLAQKVETVIYCIGTNNVGGFGVSGGVIDAPGNKELRKLAEETGGKAFFPAKVLDLDRSFSEISKELRSQYYLFYVSNNPNRDGKFRDIEVRILGRSGLRARTKRGYTAPQG